MMKWKHGQSYYKIVGDLTSGKTPVVLLHGGPGAAHNHMKPIAEFLTAAGRPAIHYHQIGCGLFKHLPEKPQSFWTIDLFKQELYA